VSGSKASGSSSPSPGPEALKQALDLAVLAAREAGAALKARGKGFTGVDAVIGRDVKLKADKAAESLILERLGPSPYPILSEEAGWVGEPGHVFWVVDPLDGSSNYDRHMPLCAVSIALMAGETPLLGVIEHFELGETYYGGPGLGAWLNGAAMTVSGVSDPFKGTLMTGLPAHRTFTPEKLDGFAREIGRWRKVRMVGSAALAAAFVAAGRADRYAEDGALLWDVAAGAALIEAAGGRALISAGGSQEPRRVCFDNGVLPD
jgi:myo-inositol-1(or 4)-monophosphatase